ncbi:MAG: hypothetical protein DRI97_06275, partial [Bacteroidetes bacterium]
LTIILFLTIMEAIHEGLALRGKNEGSARLGTIAGLVEMVKLTGMVTIILFLIYSDHYDDYLASPWHFWRWLVLQLVVGWLALRYGLFDWIHNICAGLDWKYIGKTKLYDKFLRKLMGKQPPFPFHFWTRIVLLGIGLGLILKL